MRYCRRFLAGIPHRKVDHPRVPHPSATPLLLRAFDLHVLGTPPAFILSQDQTRQTMCIYFTLAQTSQGKMHGKLQSWRMFKNMAIIIADYLVVDSIPKDSVRIDRNW